MLLSRIDHHTAGPFTGHAHHRTHAHAQLSGDSANTCPLGAGRYDRRHLIGVGFLEPSAAELDPFGLFPALRTPRG